MLETFHEQVINAIKTLLSEQYLVYCQFFDDWFAFVKNVGPKVKFLLSEGIFSMCPLKVLSQLWNGNVEIEISCLMEDPGDKMDEKTVGSILIRSELHFHGSELDSPADLIVDWYFESDAVPIGAIEHFEQSVLIIWHVGKVLVHNENVPFDNVGDMIDQ